VQSGQLIVGARVLLSKSGCSAEQKEQLFTDQVVADESCYMYYIGENV
jgi:hypothetical protein